MRLALLSLLAASLLVAEELHVKADRFESDEAKGETLFQGNVTINKGSDELNASTITIYTDINRKPQKVVASGGVFFVISTEDNNTYQGRAKKVIYTPKKKEYAFYEDVHLRQINQKKEITGEVVVVNLKDNSAYAKGKANKPVSMVFEVDSNETGIQ